MRFACEDLEHAAHRHSAVVPRTFGCEECLARGDHWVHLRLCLTCGHVGCCDDSPNTHATKHFHATHHPVIRSFEPGEEWGYCFADEAFAARLPALGGEAATVHWG